jgi:disulfide bond formation protein DsbB
MTSVLALGSVGAAVGGLLIAVIAYREPVRVASYRHYLIPAIAASATTASLFTLWYSEVLGFIPCGLCWLERAMLYPIALISIVSLTKPDRSLFRSILALSIAGFCIALYHHVLQMGVVNLPCPASGGDCTKRLVFEFGFITFPLMAASIFIWTGALAYLGLRTNNIQE